MVSLPYGFTLFSNKLQDFIKSLQFHYLMDLHYSQTMNTNMKPLNRFTTLWIYTILKLCVNNGLLKQSFTTLWIYTILKQGSAKSNPQIGFTTLWIYTILKRCSVTVSLICVSLPYGFTLFSNLDTALSEGSQVSLPYGFTLFSNMVCTSICKSFRFTTLWIYTILKLGIYQSRGQRGFTTLWIYTILKLV